MKAAKKAAAVAKVVKQSALFEVEMVLRDSDGEHPLTVANLKHYFTDAVADMSGLKVVSVKVTKQ